MFSIFTKFIPNIYKLTRTFRQFEATTKQKIHNQTDYNENKILYKIKTKY